jgi:hypothetical protein
MRCDRCQIEHPMINWCHLSGDPRLPGKMGWLCPSCHGRNDTPQRVLVTRRTRARKHGQLWLTPDLEYAHLPMILWPARVIRRIEDENQLPLFGTAA